MDDFPVVRAGLRHLIGGQADLSVVGEAATPSEARPAIARARPDLVIIEPGLGEGDALGLIADLRRDDPGLRLLACSRLPEVPYAERAVRAGAQGFVQQRESLDSLLQAIRLVLGGGVHLRAETVARVTREGETSGVGVLSDRELEVFRLIGEGHSSREIAGRLGISIKTVGTHRSNAMRKLGVTSPSRLAHLAVKWVSGLRRGTP